LRSLPVGHVVAVGDGLAPVGPDEVDDLAGGARRRACAVQLGTEVVDHDLGTLAAELDGVTAADAPAGAGDDDHPSFTNHADPFADSRSSYLTTLPLALRGSASTISTRL